VKPRRSSNLLALGSAAVLTVYTAGYARTKPAADRMAAASNERHPAPPRIDPAVAAPIKADTPLGDSAVTTMAVKAEVATVNPGDSGVVSKANKATKSAAAVAHPIDKGVHVEAEHAAPSGADAQAGVTTATPTSAPITVATAVPPSTAPTTAPVTASTSQTPPPAAPPSATTTAEAPAPPVKPVWRDGTYVGRGTSRHGDIEAMVEIKDGKITGAVISQCLTRYSCSWINHLLPQVVSRQSADVDYVSGATQSANALYYAVLQALTQAK
jgi:uncharacterized protein with FMN-binding domain